MAVSDKLFYWLFQNHPDRILALQRDLPADAAGWRFSAPVVKALERRLDGCFQPPAAPSDLPVVLLEAQMAADPGFLRRRYHNPTIQRLVDSVAVRHGRHHA